MGTSTGRRTGRHSAWRLAAAGGAGVAVAAVVAVPLPTPAPAPAAATTSSANAGALLLPGGSAAPAGLQPSAAAEVVAAASPVGDPVVPAAVAPQGSALTGSGIPAVALAAYRRAAAAAPRGCGIGWSLLAAIGRVESNHGRFGGATLGTDGRSTPRVIGPVLDGSTTARIADTDGGRLDGDATYDRAVGPMQFIPSTWARYGVDGDGDGVADPFDIADAAAAAARYLCVAGGDLSTPAGQARAVLAYNHSDSYVATVLTLAAAYAGGRVPTLPAPMPLPSIEPVNPAPPSALGADLPPAAPASTDAPVVLADGTTTPGTTTPGTTTPGTTTPGTTTPGTTTPGTTTPGTTTPGTTTPGTTTPGTMTPGATTPGTTTPGTTTPGTTTPGATTPGATTPGTTTPGTTTPGTTTPGTTTPGTTTPGTTTPGTTTPGTTTPGTTTPVTTTTSRTPAGTCPTLPRITVDVVNDTGDPTVAEDVTARLQSAGLTIGSVTSGTGATASSVSYPAAATTAATQLATALGLTGSQVQAAVDHVTLVLAGSGAGAVRAAVDRISCPA